MHCFPFGRFSPMYLHISVHLCMYAHIYTYTYMYVMPLRVPAECSDWTASSHDAQPFLNLKHLQHRHCNDLAWMFRCAGHVGPDYVLFIQPASLHERRGRQGLLVIQLDRLLQIPDIGSLPTYQRVCWTNSLWASPLWASTSYPVGALT